jgi:hypothetical protein
VSQSKRTGSQRSRAWGPTIFRRILRSPYDSREFHSCFTLKLSKIFAAAAICQTFRSNNIYSHYRHVHRSWKGPSFSRIRIFKRWLGVRCRRTLLIAFFDTGRYIFPGYKTSFITAYSTLFYMRVCNRQLALGGFYMKGCRGPPQPADD